MSTALTKVREFIEENEFEAGIFGGVSHRSGMPQGVMVKPNYNLVDGSTTVLVTADTVMVMVCETPYNFHDWQPSWFS